MSALAGGPGSWPCDAQCRLGELAVSKRGSQFLYLWRQSGSCQTTRGPGTRIGAGGKFRN